MSDVVQDQSPPKTNIYESLCSRIRAGEWPVGTCLPKEIELAAEFGCGRHSISQAVSRLAFEGIVERRKRAGTRVIRLERVDEKPRLELDAFAFIYPSENHEGIRRTVRGFQDAAQEQMRHTLTLVSGTDSKREGEFIGRLQEFDVKGAVIYSIIQTPADQVYISQLLSKISLPVVLACINLPGLELPAAFFDDFHAGYTMTKYLIDSGSKRIGYYSSSRSPDGLQGYRWALREGGIAENTRLIHMENAFHADFRDPLNEPTERSLHYLRHRSELDAVVCGFDYLAIGMMKAALQLGLRVPEDLKITGIDDYEISKSATVPLTTYHVPYEEIGRAAFELLTQRISNLPPSGLERRLTGHLVARASA